jgi:hypothetical protein
VYTDRRQELRAPPASQLYKELEAHSMPNQHL